MNFECFSLYPKRPSRSAAPRRPDPVKQQFLLWCHVNTSQFKYLIFRRIYILYIERERVAVHVILIYTNTI
jgi:hypothetical protein